MIRIFFSLSFFLLFLISCNQNHRIISVFVETTACQGVCPVFTMAITQDRAAYYHAIANNKDSGSFKTVLKQQDYDKLIALVNETDFTYLKDSYTAMGGDKPSIVLTIMHDGSEIKKIEDYGQAGTKELKQLYDFLFHLRDSQQWVNVSPKEKIIVPPTQQE